MAGWCRGLPDGAHEGADFCLSSAGQCVQGAVCAASGLLSALERLAEPVPHLQVGGVVKHEDFCVKQRAAGGNVHGHVGGRRVGIDDIGGAALRHDRRSERCCRDSAPESGSLQSQGPPPSAVQLYCVSRMCVSAVQASSSRLACPRARSAIAMATSVAASRSGASPLLQGPQCRRGICR